jgi:hypothetical protein
MRSHGHSRIKALLQLIQVAFLADQDAENEFALFLENLKNCFIDFQRSRILRRAEGTLWILLTNCHFSDFVQVTFFSPRMQKMSRLGLQTPWNIVTSTLPKTTFKRAEGKLWDHKSIRLLKTSLPRNRPSRFFGRTGCRKLFHKAFSHLEAWLHGLQQRRFLRRPDGRLWDLRDSRLLEI